MPSTAPGGALIAFAKSDLRKHAIGGRGDFNRDFIGLQLEDRLIGLHCIADVLEPSAHHRFGAFLLHRHQDVVRFSHQNLTSACIFAAMRAAEGSAHSISSG
ncbi:MAG: hypothetical protein NVV62_12125 [Terricaulis sp.]|nr:hypothetical protein [Terricaulis sp.]